MSKTITMAHGNGGKIAHELITSLFVPTFNNQELAPLADSARIAVNGNDQLVFTTDSYVVKPVFFPGGNIGKLAVCGTVNDLSVMGAKPLFLSCAMIIEEGFPIDDLKRIADSIAETARMVGVKVVTGDTKVVEKGAADKIYINTAGIGMLLPNAPQGPNSIKPGDAVILSGSVGDHGVAIYAGREGINFQTDLKSDCAPLTELVQAAMAVSPEIRVMRDPTRGGLATTLNEFTERQPFSIEVFENKVPIKEQVSGACALLGFDPLYIANEGKLVLVAPAATAEKVVSALRSHALGQEAAIIGKVTDRYPGKVYIKTMIGGERILDMLVGDMLPRIC